MSSPKINCYRIRAHTERSEFVIAGTSTTAGDAADRAYDLAADTLRHERWLELEDGGRLRSKFVIAYTVEGWFDPHQES